MTNPLTIPNSIARADARHWGRNPYTQALLTYPRRWLFRAVACWTLACTALPICLAVTQWPYREGLKTAPRNTQEIQFDGPEAVFIFTLFLTFFILPAVTAIATHARDQATTWRGSLFPGLRLPTLAVAVLLITLVISLVTASWFLPVVPYTFPGLLSIVVGIAAIGTLCSSLPPKGVAIVGIGAVALFSPRPVRLWIAYGLYGASPATPYILLSLSLLTFAALFTHLFFTRTERTPATQSDLILGKGSRWSRRPNESLSTMPLRRRLQLWRLPSSTGLMPLALAASLLVLIVFLVYSQSDDNDRAVTHPFAGLAFPLAAISVILPGAAVATQWTRRLPSLGYEFVRPTTRPRFLADLAFAMAADWFTWWFWLTLAGLLGSIYAAYKMRLPWTTADPWVFYGYAIAISLSALVQCFNFILTIWIMSFQTPWSIYLVTLLASFFSWLPAMYVLKERTDHATTLPALCLFVFALLLAAYAVYRWLHTDLI